MPQADEHQTDRRETDEATLERERACGNKLWSVYVSEAESYDQGLIDGWRSEMDGLLIFAGLFSGVVTTFIIDSYKTLNADPGGQTVVLLSQTVLLLSQISHQLASLNNGTAVTDALPPPAAFSPPVSSLVCNALWFTSLALSLSSALVATLVKQWAQEYQHRTSMFSSPSVRSRVYMYLYYGLRRFNMHAVVGVPPLLLHGSLLLFFAGLVAFLVPVNIIIMGISSALLLLFVSVYGTFTAHPLFFFDSPFQTPLTRILWSLNQSLGSVLRGYIRRAAAVWKAFIRTRVAVPDPEEPAGSTVTRPETAAEPSAPADTRPQNQSMMDALKSAALHPPVEKETRALTWAVRSLSDDDELDKLVEGLPQTLWDFDRNQPRSVYQALFQSLLRDPEIHLCQRLADFMAGSNSNLLEHKDRLRRQLSVLRAIWAVCAFSLYAGLPLQNPLGEADEDSALLGSNFLDSDEVQSMVPDVYALIRLNMIESRSQVRPPTETSSSDGNIRAEAERRRQVAMRSAYVQYLVALSECHASFQRDVTNSLFHRSQILFGRADEYSNLQQALIQLIKYASGEAADNVVFTARQMIALFAQTSDYPQGLYVFRLGPFLLLHPTLTVPEPRSDRLPAATHHYTRVLCHWLCGNLNCGIELQPSVDALELIYRNLHDSGAPPRDIDAHLHVLRTLRTDAANIRTHRLVAIIQSVVLESFRPDLSGWERLPDIFDDADWSCSAVGLDTDERVEQDRARLVYECACLGVVTTFLEQCIARSPDRTEHDLDLAALEPVRYALGGIFSVPTTELQRRFADAVSRFVRKYPKDCLADDTELHAVLYRAVSDGGAFITNVDALRVLDTVVSEVQTDDQQQESHRQNAQWIHQNMQKRLWRPRPEENIPAQSVPLITDGE